MNCTDNTLQGMGSTGEALRGAYSNRRIVLLELFTARGATILRTSEDTAPKKKNHIPLYFTCTTTHREPPHYRNRSLFGSQYDNQWHSWVTLTTFWQQAEATIHWIAWCLGRLVWGAWRLCMSSKHQAKCVGRSHFLLLRLWDTMSKLFGFPSLRP